MIYYIRHLETGLYLGKNGYFVQFDERLCYTNTRACYKEIAWYGLGDSVEIIEDGHEIDCA